jgi:hypothetical protein
VGTSASELHEEPASRASCSVVRSRVVHGLGKPEQPLREPSRSVVP